MSSINGISSSLLNSLFAQGLQSKTDPAQKFKELDTDGSGSLDKTELSALAKELSKMTGKTLNVDDSITTYDANSDGLLSRDEVGAMIRQTLGTPPGSGSNPSAQQATQAYQAHAGEDPLATLLQTLEQTTDTSTASGSSDDTLSILLKMLEQTQNAPLNMKAPPNPEEKFKELDTDNSGGLNTSELEVMANDISARTGQTIDTASALSTYDTDGDGELSKTEMDTMMQAMRDASGAPPPPPPANAGANPTESDQTGSTTATNQADPHANQVALVRQLLEQYAKALASSSDGNLTFTI